MRTLHTLRHVRKDRVTRELYRRTLRRCGRVTTLVEWDDHIPPFAEVVAESRRAAALEREVLGGDVAA